MKDIDHAQLDWDAQGQPLSSQFDDVYFSKASGLDESRYVFIEHNQLAQRFAALDKGHTFVIGETGFGTGLNFLCAWQCFLAHAPADTRLHFISVEKYPLQAHDLAKALELWPELAELREQLLQQYLAIHAGFQHLQLDNGRVSLTLLIGDVLDMLSQLDAAVDAWFLDGFAPSKNPEMWNEAVFAQLARLSAAGSSLATFTSAGFVRRGLLDAGFAVQREAGFGRKREMLAGQFQPTEDDIKPRQEAAPWFARPTQTALAPEQRHAIVIGAGLAGCSSAASLAARGWRVTLIEQHDTIAQQASGNAQGALYLKLSAHNTALSRLVLAGFGYTRRLLAAHSAGQNTQPALDDNDWSACGVLQLAFNDKEQQRQAELAAHFPSSLLHPVDAEQASQLAGIELDKGGLFFPEAGWVNPPALCRLLSTHPLITLQTSQQALTLTQQNQVWHVHDADALLASAAVLVLCNAEHVTQFSQTAHLPLKPIRGQTTQLPANPQQPIHCVVSGKGYISPARHQQHTIGASFNFTESSQAPSLAEHRSNLALLNELSASFKQQFATDDIDVTQLKGHAAFRCTSTDYLPIIGPVAQHAAFMDSYAELRKNARRPVQHACPWHTGLYVNTAHGSRGLISTPLAAELLAAWICAEPLPVPLELAHECHPNRFALRSLIRNQV